MAYDYAYKFVYHRDMELFLYLSYHITNNGGSCEIGQYNMASDMFCYRIYVKISIHRLMENEHIKRTNSHTYSFTDTSLAYIAFKRT